ncbi:hypothetical protein CRG98_020543 [Punica granatum]|uniref:G-patch domain-containing protein n=1 Tax=Punica granatum TaxID=22663 RepID=A0A2I0JRX6_PUNGR|nr:hypothetical protein CRG98_020543 [Punica granatum]
MAEEDRVDVSEEVNPPAPALSQPPPMHAPPPPTPPGMLQAYSGAPPTHPQPLTSLGAPLARASQTPSASDDQACIAALEGTVNQMATSMAELLALLKGSNRTSSSSTPPLGPGPTADPTPWAPPTQAPENMEAPVPPTLHTSVAHPFTSQFPPPPAPTAVPLPSATFLSSEHVLSAPPPISIPAPAMAYTVPPPMVFPTSSAGDARPDAHYGDCNLFPGMRLPPKFKVPEFKTYEGITDPRHHLRHYRGKMLQYWEYEEFEEYAAKWRAQATKHIPPISEAQQIQLFHSTLWGVYYSHLLAHTLLFSDLIEAGKKLDLGIKLGRMEDPTNKGEESSKKAPAAPSSSGERRAKEVSVNAVNTAHQAPQQYSVNLTTTPTTAPTYFPPPPQHQPQSIYYSAPPIPPPTSSQPYNHFAPPSAQPSQPRPPVSRASPPAQQNPTPQGQQVGGAQNRLRKQYTPLPAPLSHIYRQLLAGNQIQPVSPGLNFDPSVQDQSKHCEYHQGAPGHTLDNCWRLWDEIQRRIDSNRLTFNAVRPPNVQANPIPDHRPSSGPSINMISVCVSGRDEEAQENPPPFVINYTPEELTVGFTGHVASSAPFVVDIPAREPYSDSKVPWTYEGSVGSIEQQFSVIGVTRSGRVTEEEAEAFMKIVKASEYKVVEQMVKSPAHISLLALLLGLEPHREALLRETPPDRIEETIGSIFSNTISFSDDELSSEVTTLRQMNVDLNRVRPSKTAVRAFDGSRREVNGEIDLLIDVGPCSFNITFQVLDILNALSLLLRRLWIHSAGAIPSSLYQRLKFIVEEKLITVKGEEDHAIYKEMAVPYISVGDDENLPFHSFETISVIRDYGESGPSRADRVIGKVPLRNNYIPGTGLGARGQGISRPIEIEEYKHRKGLGFRPSCHEIIEARRGNHLHHLAEYYGKLNRGIPLRRQRASLLLRIKEELVKHINAGFLEVCNYSEWVANIVPVEKKDGRVRVCVDYRDLNKASPKDNFSLPHIDVLVDNTARHAQFSFMDGFSRYNQIRMAEKDKLKTTFTTMWGTFCYRVMPFGLKNAGATYQRAMVTLFHDMMHKEVEVYVDDMIAKSKEGEYHLVNLKRLFDRSLGCMLGQEDESTRTERAIYYLSKKFTEGESNYLEIEKMCCALVWVMQRLRQYTLYHTIRLLSKANPLRYLLDSPSSMRNNAKWRCQLTEYDIEYVPRMSVKGQAIADHLAEFPIDDDRPINTDFPDEGIL